MSPTNPSTLESSVAESKNTSSTQKHLLKHAIMQSEPGILTPASRSDEATEEASNEGLIHAFFTMVPAAGAVMIAMRDPRFVKWTNWQSRTALVVMPTLFMFSFSGESRHLGKMREIANETKHSSETVRWAEDALEHIDAPVMNHRETEEHLLKLYQKSVKDSGVNIVPGDQLGIHHRIANYTAANPIKVLATLALPSVAWIFYGNTGKQHLDFSVKLMHTRVFGQFATISILLGVIGFKEFMDYNGRFITEREANDRVEEMQHVRQALMSRLHADKEQVQAQQQKIKSAHDQDVKNHNVHSKKKKVQKQSETQDATDPVASTV
jgi:hypothetical protein